MLASRKQLTVELLLVLVATVWGWTFVLVKDALELYPTLPFLTLRFVLATVLIGPVGLWRWWSGDRSRRALVGGLIMGSFLAAAYVFQTFGLSLTTASNAGFITGLAVVLVPPVSYTHLRAHETDSYLVCRLLLEKKKKKNKAILTPYH